MVRASYITRNAFLSSERGKLTRELAEFIRGMVDVDSFDTIAFMGVSGAIIAPSVADILGKHITVVRKPRGKESRHSGYGVEGWLREGMRFIIIDDFISSGKTIKYIESTVREFSHGPAKLLAVFLYCGYNSSSCALEYGEETENVYPVYALPDKETTRIRI